MKSATIKIAVLIMVSVLFVMCNSGIETQKVIFEDNLQSNTGTINQTKIDEYKILVDIDRKDTVSESELENIKTEVLYALNDSINIKVLDLTGKLEHTIYSFIIGNRILITSFTTSEVNHCHACGTELSFFIFEKQQEFIEKTKEYLYTKSIGAWGTAPDKDVIDVKKIANEYILIIEQYYNSMGYASDYLTLFYTTNNTFNKLGDIKYGYSDEGASKFNELDTQWKAIYTFKEQKDKTPIIILNIKGIKKGKNFTKEEVYNYNGDKYVVAE